VPIGVVGKDLDEQDLMEFIPRFWKEKSVEDVVILGPTAQATLVFMEWVLREKPRGEGKQKMPQIGMSLNETLKKAGYSSKWDQP